MRSRLLAFLILVVIIGIPAGIYWYFFSQNTASLTVSIGTDDIFFIKMEGTLDNENLPLADRLLMIEKECNKTCTISPIAPVKYNLVITSSAKTPIEDTITIGVSEDKVVSYTLRDEIYLEGIDYNPVGSPMIGDAILRNARSQNTQIEYSLVGIDGQNRVYVVRDTLGRRELGILTMNRFAPLYVIPEGVGIFSMDRVGQYLMAPIGDTGTLVLSLDMSVKKEIPIVGVIGYENNYGQEKIYTQSGVLMLSGEKYIPNPRFTDWIDVSATQRIGYIRADDADRLALSNLPLGTSVLILVDRYTGEDIVIRRGVSIDRFFLFEGKPAYIDASGRVYTITL